ncbi:MAG: HD domain-containing protein [Candidatus Micrarchaeota archaeon]|nr:HD domain-containing protein [Candidatus Micrarchaeota archaeon]
MEPLLPIKILSLRPGQQVSGIFAVKIRKSLGTYTKGYRLDLILTDSTGASIAFTLWGGQGDDVRAKLQSLLNSITEDAVLHITGAVDDYNGELCISANSIDSLRILREGEFPPDAFIQPARRDPQQMRQELSAIISSVASPHLKPILSHVFTPQFMDKFIVHPAAVQHHHNRIGGLAEHTIEVVRICEELCRIYPKLDRDLLITGALLHDIGKVREITVTKRIKADSQGQLVGHLAHTTLMLSEALAASGTPEPLRSKLLHLSLSHHGRNDYGSPKEPMFPEAVALHYADETSAMVAEMLDFIEEHKPTTLEDTMYSRTLRRNIYLR